MLKWKCHLRIPLLYVDLYLLHRDIGAVYQYWEESQSALDKAALKRSGSLLEMSSCSDSVI
ncbi:hypothetical protein T4B_15258 [Trichinella pseudospiralis]|uniref:Uncharacterized protein n=1 Tax=Trichinella pseudospiralis TaxID=6337 RepID=A0A0V1GPE1_TRIPS|nr:hypothetical protein T4B_15258 [Trichinella pseudospiralis]